jgi:DNA-binding response OmpR family regulator
MSPKSRGSSNTILFVDDDPIVSEVGGLLLRKIGYNVIHASSGQQAIEIYKQRKDAIDLIILDMIMPGQSGEQTFGKLIEVNKQVKIIISSGSDQDERIHDILARGGAGFIYKPYKISELKAKLDEALSRSLAVD